MLEISSVQIILCILSELFNSWTIVQWPTVEYCEDENTSRLFSLFVSDCVSYFHVYIVKSVKILSINKLGVQGCKTGIDVYTHICVHIHTHTYTHAGIHTCVYILFSAAHETQLYTFSLLIILIKHWLDEATEEDARFRTAVAEGLHSGIEPECRRLQRGLLNRERVWEERERLGPWGIYTRDRSINRSVDIFVCIYVLEASWQRLLYAGKNI